MILKAMHPDLPLFKTLLYVPADKPRMLEKSRDLPCSAVIFDLEDAVAPNEKSSARESLIEFLKQPFDKPYFVRINSVGTEQFESDLQSLL